MKFTLMQGHVFDRLPEIESNSIDLCITSPPYWGLRSYGVEGELGAEATMELYLDNTLRWVKEVFRVLKPTGSFVLNIGDCFIGGGRGTKPGPASLDCNHAEVMQAPNWNALRPIKENVSPHAVCPVLGGIYKSKQLLSVSSFAYCRIVSETNFVCRGEHLWCKNNIPSPIRSRLKHSHEKLFWFVKDAGKYYFDAKPWLKNLAITTPARMQRAHLTVRPQSGYDGEHRIKPNTRSNDEQLRYMRGKVKGQAKMESSEEFRKKYEGGSFHKHAQETIEHSWRIVPVGEKQKGFEIHGRLRSEHIAPFPETLIAPYVKSLCPPGGIILDPFVGSGTVMKVARDAGRSCTGIDLNPSYLAYAKKRVNWANGLDGAEYEEK